MNIMMVCLGKICRSPLAEGILNDRIKKAGLPWYVASSGTSGAHNGERPHRASIAVARKNGIDITGQRSQQFSPYDFDEYDHILVMDDSNYNAVLSLTRTEAEKKKVKRLLDYLPALEDKNVPDPYYHGGFDKVYKLIDEACKAFVATHTT